MEKTLEYFLAVQHRHQKAVPRHQYDATFMHGIRPAVLVHISAGKPTRRIDHKRREGCESCCVCKGCCLHKKDEEGNEIPKRGFVLKYSPVFNIEQTTGIEMPVTIEVEVIEAEEYLERAKAKPMIRYGGDRAFYYPEGDCIQLPLKSQFTSSLGYYETFFHEIGHWTGQSSRLNRNLCTEQTARAREELTAEMFAGFCLHKVGVNSDINNVAAYIQSWIRALENDKKALLWASREARKAVQYFESGIIPDSIILSINNN